jgi:hypothetical protein
MPDARLVVVSCPHRQPIQEIWTHCQQANWPDCPYPIDILSPTPDTGWNHNLLSYLIRVEEPLILLMLDDHFLGKPEYYNYTDNMLGIVLLMMARPDIGMIKLQAGNAHSPEIPFEEMPILREYDRAHHPFKRTNLVPTMFRRQWLIRLCDSVLHIIGADRDVGRNGALEFESTGTKLTMDTTVWPERMLGIHRPHADGGGGKSLLNSISNDGLREGRFHIDLTPLKELGIDPHNIKGIEAFL